MVTAGIGAWLSAIYLGLLPSALGFVLWGIAVRALSVAAATSLLYLVPGIAVLIGFVWLGELPTSGEAVGGLVIVAGVALLTNADRLPQRHHRRAALARATPTQNRSDVQSRIGGVQTPPEPQLRHLDADPTQSRRSS
jgi:hypothetical protein